MAYDNGRRIVVPVATDVTIMPRTTCEFSAVAPENMAMACVGGVTRIGVRVTDVKVRDGRKLWSVLVQKGVEVAVTIENTTDAPVTLRRVAIYASPWQSSR